MSISNQDKNYMRLALQLAKLGRFTTSPNPNVGCIIVKDNKIIGKGFHQKAGLAHAEINALNMAGSAAKGANVYVTLEPCSHYGRTPPCAKALINAQVKRVFIAIKDPNPLVAGRGIAMLKAANIEVYCNILETEAFALNQDFFHKMQHSRPWVQLKLAASLDGKIALANGVSQWITSPIARADVQKYRAQACAILSTSKTVTTDNASLNVRFNQLAQDVQDIYPQEYFRQPKRVILDRKYKLSNLVNKNLNIFNTPGELILVHPQGFEQDENKALKENEIASRCDEKGFILTELLDKLAARNINKLWVEAGACLAGSFIENDLVDELIVYLAPKIMGDKSKSLVTTTLFTLMEQVPEFKFVDVSKIGTDLKIILQRKD